MIGLLRILSDRGERAARRGLSALVAAGLLVLALGFGAGAVVEALAEFLPRYAALGIVAFLLAVAAAIVLHRSRAAPSAASAPPADVHPVVARRDVDWRAAIEAALIRTAADEPARAAALAAMAGLVVGALDGLKDDGRGKS
jgi:hypothetical protein